MSEVANVSPAELVEICSSELAEFELQERNAEQALNAALAAFKAEPTNKNRKAGVDARTDAEFAALAREGAQERLAEAREALAVSEHEAAVAEVTELFNASSVQACRAAIADDARELAALRTQAAELENKISMTVSEFRSGRARALAAGSKLSLTGMRDLNCKAIVADALDPGEPRDDSDFELRFVTAAEEQAAERAQYKFKAPPSANATNPS